MFNILTRAHLICDYIFTTTDAVVITQAASTSDDPMLMNRAIFHFLI